MYTNAFNISTFFLKFLSVLFCVRALDSLINYSFFMNSVHVFEKALLSLLFYTQNHPFIAHDFFIQKVNPYFPFSLLFVEGYLRAYYLQLSTGSTQEGPSRHK